MVFVSWKFRFFAFTFTRFCGFYFIVSEGEFKEYTNTEFWRGEMKRAEMFLFWFSVWGLFGGRALAATGSSTEERELNQTPTWAVASVCAVIIIISILLEKSLHKLGTVGPVCLLLIELSILEFTFFYAFLLVLNWFLCIGFSCFCSILEL